MQQKIILVCDQCLSRNYNTFTNSSNQTVRLSLKKFCKHCNQHTIHKETR
ncbi:MULTISPECIES: 50S ribosomal protein L33 [unclassified Spiroplasma]|jgi:large subunit ribosomal protein L33|nr:50S ribosomal protein L33 [Spiroplasma endosymbiont of 'Nebria riversi']